MRLRILVVDPNPLRRAEYQRALAKHDVRLANDAAGADQAAEADLVLVSLAQATGHGLEVGKQAKKRMKSAQVIVYGKPSNVGLRADTAAQTWGIDRYTPNIPGGLDVIALADAVVQSARRAMRTSIPPGGPNSKSWEEILSDPPSNLRALLTKDLRSR